MKTKVMKRTMIMISVLLFGIHIHGADEQDSNTAILTKAKLFVSVLFKQHVLTYSEAISLWGETSELSFFGEIIACGIKTPIDYNRNFFELVNKDLKQIAQQTEKSLYGLLIQSTVSNDLNIASNKSVVIYAVSYLTERYINGRQSSQSPGIVTITIIQPHNDSLKYYVFTIPFDKNNVFNISCITYGNELLSKHVGIEFDASQGYQYNKMINNLIIHWGAQGEIDIAKLREMLKKSDIDFLLDNENAK